MSYPFYDNQLRMQYRLLRHEGHYTQVHCHDVRTKKVVSRELIYGEKEVIAWAKENNGKGNCFIGGNPRSKDGNVVTCTALSLDLDPDRAKDTAATDEQHHICLQNGRKIVVQFGYGVVSSSGNGVLVIFPIEDTDPETAERMGAELARQARNLLGATSTIKVDHTHDAPRLFKCMGTISTKGDPALWRAARFIDTPIFDHNRASRFFDWLNKSRPLLESNGKQNLPELTRGMLDRSKLDYTIAVRLKETGFGPNDTYNALCSYAARPGREDDYKRIVGKLYSSNGGGSGSQNSNVGSIQLWTPENGLDAYQQRDSRGCPELPTGFAKLDAAIFGLQRGSITTIGARTNCGKTTFAITVALNLCRLGKKVAYISTETSYQEIWDRYFAAGTQLSAFAIQHSLLSGPNKETLSRFMEGFKSHKFVVYDGSRPSVDLVRRIVEQDPPDVVIFDYFQHVEAKDTRALEELVMNMKDLAKEKNVALLMCAQLHDRYNPTTQKMWPPTLQDMKSCKALNDESRVVMLLDWERDKATGDAPAPVKLILAKNKGVKEDLVLKLDRRVPVFTEE